MDTEGMKSIPGSVVLVGHSYGGAVITEAVNGNANVMSLVFVNGFTPDAGEFAPTLAEKFLAVRSAARSPRCRRPGARHRPLYLDGEFPHAVCRRPSRRAGIADGHDAAACDGRGTCRTDTRPVRRVHGKVPV